MSGMPCRLCGKDVTTCGCWGGRAKSASGFRKVSCPVLPPLNCTWPRCNCEVDLMYSTRYSGIPKRGVR